MQERLINERRDWKAQVFPYDYYLPDDSTECQYCLTDKQAELLRGLVEPLAWRTRWWSSSDAPIELSVIEEYRADLVRRLMMGCCGDEIPVQFRYSDDGTLQRSEDGGTTWTDAPEYDPRVNSPQFPPMSGEDGEDKKCIAATGAADLIKQQVGDQLTDDMSRYTLGQLLTDWTGTVINSGGNIFQALVTVATNQIFALVIATLRPALTEEVYEQLKCIFYCDIADDATINDAQWATIRSKILSQIGGIAGIFLEHLVYLLGTGGMTNLLRAGGAAAGDCSDCDCDQFVRIYVMDGTATEQSWNSGTGELTATAALVEGIYQIWFGFDPNMQLPATFADPDICGTCTLEVIEGVDDAAPYNRLCHETSVNTAGLSSPTSTSFNSWILRGNLPFTVKAYGAVRT